MLCSVKTALQSFPSYTLISHANAHAVRGRPTLNDDKRFRNEPRRERRPDFFEGKERLYTS